MWCFNLRFAELISAKGSDAGFDATSAQSDEEEPHHGQRAEREEEEEESREREQRPQLTFTNQTAAH